MKQLLLRLGVGLCKSYLIHGPRLSIGRDPVSDIVLVDDRASRQHARIDVAQDTTSWVVDLGSLNGVLVNDQRIARPQPLRHLDVITLGSVRFRFFEAATYRDSELGFSS